MDTVTVAAVNWILLPGLGTQGLLDHAKRLIDDAVRRGAEWIVLPECVTLEALPSKGRFTEPDVPQLLVDVGAAWVDLMRELAGHHGVTIVAGSHFTESPGGILHVSAVADPLGNVAIQPKNNLTTYEREVWRLAEWHGVASAPDPRLGVLVCYDCEFPEAGRVVAESSAMVLAVPAFTETEHGFHRVRLSAHARAIENQMYVVHASLGGDLGGEPVPRTVSGSAILAPSIDPFPADGVVAETPHGAEGIAVATLDLSELERARETGDVRNWHDRRRSKWTPIA